MATKQACSGKQTWTKKIRKIRRRGNIAYVPLTRGKVAIIDAADIPLVQGWNWCAKPDAAGKIWYAYSAGRRKITLHSHLMGKKPGLRVDHRDRNGLNCRRSNMRFSTPLQNSMNRGVRDDSGSGYKGVSKHGKKWRVRIVVDGARHFLGSFSTPEIAARVYDIAAKRAFGEFAALNFGEAR